MKVIVESMMRLVNYLAILAVVMIVCFGACAYSMEGEAKLLEKVELNVGQTKHIKIPIYNDKNVPLVVDRVSVCCGNPKPSIDVTTIAPGASAEVIQVVKKTKSGTFSVKNTIKFKEPKDLVLLFKTEVEAKQPIAASIGWAGGQAVSVDHKKKTIRLTPVNFEGGELVLNLYADPSVFSLDKTFVEMISKYFEVEESSFKLTDTKSIPSNHLLQTIKTKTSHNDGSGEIVLHKGSDMPVVSQQGGASTDGVQSIDMMKLKLKAKTPLAQGELTDKIIVEFKDGTACYIPVVFRSIGDVYGESSSLAVGAIPSDSIVHKNFKICFAKGIKPWTQLKWKAEGKISKAIDVSLDSEDGSDDIISVQIAIDGNRLSASNKGFMSSYVNFFEEKNSDSNAIRLLIYGYRL